MDIDNQLQAYITNARAGGSQDSQIREALVAAGYSQDAIKRAFTPQSAAQSVIIAQRNSKKKNHVRIIAVAFGILLTITVISLIAAVKIRRDNSTQNTQTLPANLTKESIDFDGQTFIFNYPKNWISKKDSLTDADRNVQTADYTLYNSADDGGDHGLIRHGASFEIHVGKYGTGGISEFKNDLEHNEQKGFYKPLSVAENIAQTTIESKPAITYTESADHRQVVVIFFDAAYAVQISSLRPYTETPGKDVTVDTTYQKAFYDMVGSFSVE